MTLGGGTQLLLGISNRNLNELKGTLKEQKITLNPHPKEFDLMLPPKFSYCRIKKVNNNGVDQTVWMC